MENLVYGDGKSYGTATVIALFHKTDSYASPFAHLHLRTDTRWRSWLRSCVGSIPDGVTGIFH
jgi:hypothetical protein